MFTFVYMIIFCYLCSVKIKHNPQTNMCRTLEEKIKEELSNMMSFMEAEEDICSSAGIDFNGDYFLKDSFQRIAERQGCSVEQIEEVFNTLSQE